jgi:hypothetical protein
MMLLPKKIWRKNWRFLPQMTAIYCMYIDMIITLVLRKTPNFCRKLAKIPENCDYSIDPRSRYSVQANKKFLCG